jgi:excisionase family DNA binding protein
VDNDLITYEEAARYLSLPVGSLYSLVHRGEVPHIRMGRRTVRFSRRALASWVAARTVGAVEADRNGASR